MLVDLDGYRFDIDVDTTRAYYETLRARPATDPVKLNHRKFMEEHVSARILKFLNGLGITDFAGLRYDGAIYHEKLNAMRYMRAAYPVFGKTVNDEYIARQHNFLVSPGGRITKMSLGGGFNIHSLYYPFKLCFRVANDADKDAMFGDLQKPVLRLEWCNGMAPSWVLDAPCPIESEEHKAFALHKRNRDELETELSRLPLTDARTLSEREWKKAMYSCIDAFCVKGARGPVWDEYIEYFGTRWMDGSIKLARRFVNAKELCFDELETCYAGLHTKGYTLLIGDYMVGVHATGALPPLEYVDTLLHLGAFIVDDALDFCFAAIPDVNGAPYLLARRRDI